MKTQVCEQCGFERDIKFFGFTSNRKDRRRRKCKSCRHGVSTEAQPDTPRFFRQLDSRRYIITAAQNNTPVHPGFWDSLLQAAKHLSAQLVVIPYRYKNPTGMNPGRDLRQSSWCNKAYRGSRCFLEKNHEGEHCVDELWWDPKLESYLHNVRKKLNDNLVLAADVKIQATNSSPVTGFESLTGAESCILGHPKMQMRTVPVPSGQFPKILTTTGACTNRNYSNTKAGALGEFHHFLGGLIVEVRGKVFHLRQLNADRNTGSFIDLNMMYTPDGVTDAPQALGLIMGDTHVRVTDPKVYRATFGSGNGVGVGKRKSGSTAKTGSGGVIGGAGSISPKAVAKAVVAGDVKRSMVDVLNPKTLVFHDIFDGETVNPHDADDQFIAEAKRRENRLSIRDELQEVVDFINRSGNGRDVVIVNSNHHDFLRRWVVKCMNNGCRDPKNADIFLESALHMRRTAKMAPGGAEYGDPFIYWMEKLGVESRVKCLKPDESFTLGQIEVGAHGDDGPNGSKGSIKNMSRLGVRTVIGHTHTPGIEEGCYNVGTSSYRRLSYQRGPGSHLNTHCVVYGNGKRALLTVIGDEWCLQG